MDKKKNSFLVHVLFFLCVCRCFCACFSDVSSSDYQINLDFFPICFVCLFISFCCRRIENRFSLPRLYFILPLSPPSPQRIFRRFVFHLYRFRNDKKFWEPENERKTMINKMWIIVVRSIEKKGWGDRAIECGSMKRILIRDGIMVTREQAKKEKKTNVFLSFVIVSFLQCFFFIIYWEMRVAYLVLFWFSSSS